MLVEVEEFYKNKQGDKLIYEDNYPEEIKNFLKGERDIFLRLLNKQRYNCLFEVGCMNARNLDIALESNKKYYGIDIVDRYITDGQQLINSKNVSNIAKVKTQSVIGINVENTPIIDTDTPLAIFPFNSIGNICLPRSALEDLFNLKYDLAISTYDTTSIANKIRRNYYENCNYNNLQQINDREAVIFRADEGLNSFAFNRGFYENIKPYDYHLQIIKNLDFGIVYYFKTRKSKL